MFIFSGIRGVLWASDWKLRMPATTFPKRHSKLGGQKGFGTLVRHSKFQSGAIYIIYIHKCIYLILLYLLKYKISRVFHGEIHMKSTSLPILLLGGGNDDGRTLWCPQLPDLTWELEALEATRLSHSEIFCPEGQHFCWSRWWWSLRLGLHAWVVAS